MKNPVYPGTAMSICIRRYKRPSKRWLIKFSGNFGDDMNPILVRHITGSKCKEVYNKNESYNVPVYLVIGTILHWADEKTIVWGAGFGSTDAEVKSKPIDVCAVRGPLTRKRLSEIGIKAPEIYGDPAILYPKYYTSKRNVKYDIGFIPHYSDANNPVISSFINQSSSISLIDVTRPVNEVVDRIHECRMILSSSLHGIIVSHAYGKRAIHVSFELSPFRAWYKFYDYYESIGIKDYEGPAILNPNSSVKEIEKLLLLSPESIEFDSDKLLNSCPFLPQK
jgi:pyruvyltransferase